MSTRSIIVVHGEDLYEKNKTVRLYKHSDGYPTGALEVIQNAIELIQKHKYEDYKTKAVRINVSTMVGMLIGAGTSEYGMGVRIDSTWTENGPEQLAEYNEAFETKHLGGQSDLEWIYIIDVAKQTVSIFGGGYTGKNAQSFKLANPYDYANCLIKECQASEIAETDKLIRYIEAWGFKVLCKKPASKHKQSKPSLKAVSRE